MEDILIAPDVEKEEMVAEGLPEEILAAALDYANRVEGTSHVMSIDEAQSRLYQRLGWIEKNSSKKSYISLKPILEELLAE